MGNTHSVSRVDRQDTKRPEYGRRKLSKPRVGNYSGRRGLSYFPPPSAVTVGRVLNAKNEAVQEISSAAPWQQAIWGDTSIPDLENETCTLKSWGPHRRHHSLYYSRHPLSHTRNQSPDLAGSYRGTSRPHSRYGSTRNSKLTSQSRPEPEATDLLQSHPPPSVMHRRSQIFAAPPATKTRQQPTFTLEGGVPAPQQLALELAGRAQTPTGYSVLGGFKRGSLRIVNTTASPSPPQDARPRRHNTSPAHGNTSTHSLRTVTPTPQLTVTPGDNGGYFGNYGILTVLNPTLNGSPTLGEAFQLRALTPASFETAPEEIYHSDQSSEGHTPPIIDLLKPQCTSTFLDNKLMPSEVQKTGQELDSLANYTLTQSSAHERHSSFTSHKIAGTPDNSPILRSASSCSSIYSDPLETKDTQRSSARRPSVKTGTDSGYCSAGSIKSCQSWSATVDNGDFHTACTTPSTELDKRISENNPEPEIKREQPDSENQCLQVIQQNEVPLRSTDKYRIRASLEGPIYEDTVLYDRAPRPSLQMSLRRQAYSRSRPR
ncbi:hypothetical protein L211DRAFT_844915 [Terfezia boudieri ATCC MYA-4762]|uniref:Uncharacterized protein n=1 Tax=Terfezia boudieri ATCC MYA-4762 TaxID=1051890 RepID=A0A3N4M100_9PEZI|nr:hypothetical protein L211DRAFT_844915 [Terfezia boudieri ATCC MYA-4762]